MEYTYSRLKSLALHNWLKVRDRGLMCEISVSHFYALFIYSLYFRKRGISCSHKYFGQIIWSKARGRGSVENGDKRNGGKDSCSEFRGDKSGHWARDSGRRTHRAWARKKMVLTKSFFCDKEKEGR